jgi:hypothetical protein
MTERSKFLSLVERFLSWRLVPGSECRNASLYEEGGKTFVVYDMINARGSIKRVMASGLDFDDCASNSISYMCMRTNTSGKEELDLFLSSAGF